MILVDSLWRFLRAREGNSGEEGGVSLQNHLVLAGSPAHLQGLVVPQGADDALLRVRSRRPKEFDKLIALDDLLELLDSVPIIQDVGPQRSKVLRRRIPQPSMQGTLTACTDAEVIPGKGPFTSAA